jgi:hypothetical protein
MRPPVWPIKTKSAIELPAAEKSKLEALTIPLRNEWIKDMASRGLPGAEVLDAAIEFLNEK